MLRVPAMFLSTLWIGFLPLSLSLQLHVSVYWPRAEVSFSDLTDAETHNLIWGIGGNTAIKLRIH